MHESTSSIGRTLIRSLGLALQIAPPVDSAEARAADGNFDDAWGGFYAWGQSCLKLNSVRNPDLAGTQALMDFLFPTGTTFLKDRYLVAWQESQSRLNALADPANQSYLDMLNRLEGGQTQWSNVQDAHTALGAALGITQAKVEAASAVVKAPLQEVLSTMREYCEVDRTSRGKAAPNGVVPRYSPL